MDINITNINDFDMKQIIFSKSFFIGLNKKKISIGYGDNVDIHILTPFFTNIMNYINGNKYQYLKIVFDPMLGNILKFYNIIQSLEYIIKDHILKHNKDYVLQSIIRDDQDDLFSDNNIDINTIKNICLKLINYSKSDIQYKIYDDNCEECSLNNLKYGWKYKGLIKFESIWIDTQKKKFGLNLELVQLKIKQPITQIKCLIDNDNIIIKKDIHKYSNNKLNTDQNIITNIPLNNEIAAHLIPAIEIKTKNFIPPNTMELLKIKNALKKVLE
jgi:hypothetical protein